MAVLKEKGELTEVLLTALSCKSVSIWHLLGSNYVLDHRSQKSYSLEKLFPAFGVVQRDGGLLQMGQVYTEQVQAVGRELFSMWGQHTL